MNNEITRYASEHPEFSNEALREADEKIAVITLVKGDLEAGNPYWAFIAIPPSKLIPFKSAQSKGQAFSIADYGDILEAGEGLEPPQQVMQEMIDKYGFDPNFGKKSVDQFVKFKAKKADEKQTNFLMEKIKEMKAKQGDKK